MNESDLASLLGPAPSSKDMLDVRYDNVQEVLNKIARQEPPLFQDIRPVPSGKLKFNRLSEGVQTLLTSGMQKADLVGNFFNEYCDPLYGDEIASTFNKEELLRHAILAFEKISSALYEEAGSFTIDASPNGPLFDVTIRGEKSKGISNMQIFCFDMMFM